MSSMFDGFGAVIDGMFIVLVISVPCTNGQKPSLKQWCSTGGNDEPRRIRSSNVHLVRR